MRRSMYVRPARATGSRAALLAGIVFGMASAEEWAKRVEGWRASGQTAEDYATPRGWQVKALWKWSSKLHQQEKARRRSALVPVRAVSKTAPRRDPALTLRLGGAELEIRAGVDAALLREVVSVLRERS